MSSTFWRIPLLVQKGTVSVPKVKDSSNEAIVEHMKSLNELPREQKDQMDKWDACQLMVHQATPEKPMHITVEWFIPVAWREFSIEEIVKRFIAGFNGGKS
jgi:hypothetical protein